jgi:probable phosphoglycerate mutase
MQLITILLQDENIAIIIFIGCAIAAILMFKVLSPKRIYFVRHGETILNAAHIRQDNTGGLTEVGKEQAKVTGLRLSKMHIGHMYVSPYERTVETAAIINETAHVPFTYTKLLAERRNPSEIVGKKYDDLEVEKIINHIDLANHDQNFRYSNEENFADLQARAKKLLRYLAYRPHTTIACVTHGIFLKMVLAHIVYGAKLTPLVHATLTYLTTVNNAGITLVTYNPWNFFVGKKSWNIVVFNDISKV